MADSKLTYFVSDLHMYSSRSQEERYLKEIERKAAHADQFVLGGDIFDFRWSTMDSHEETVAGAADCGVARVRILAEKPPGLRSLRHRPPSHGAWAA